MEIIDSHAHIYLPDFAGDLAQILQRASDADINKILMPAVDASTHEQMLRTEAEHAGCVAMMGLHPCSVTENYKQELDIVEQHLAARKFVAVGEIGLDFYWDKTFTDQQYEAFHQQIKWALQYYVPIVIHSRNATDECIEVVKQYPGLKGVFHCFSGNTEQAQQVIDAGFMLGIGGVVTFKNGGLDKVVAKLGLQHVILETDAPYLTPAPYRGKRNEPSYTKLVAEKVAEITGKSLIEVAEITTKNVNNLFKL